MSVRLTSRRRNIVAAVASVIALTTAHQAMAALMTSSTVNAQVTVGENPSVTDSEGPSGGNIFSRADDFDAPVSTAIAVAWVNTSNAFAAAALGAGNFDAEGRIERTFTVSNDLAVAATGVLDIYIYGGFLYAIAQPGSTGMGGSAAYELDIDIGNNNLFTSSVSVQSGSAPIELGTKLDGANFDALNKNYSWLATQKTFDLGVLAPGQSIDIDYTLITTASGRYGQIIDSSPGGCEGDMVCCVGEFQDEVPSECTRAGGDSWVFLGDPAGLSGQREPLATPPDFARTSFTLTPVSVPAPGGLLALFGAASALALRRRRRA